MQKKAVVLYSGGLDSTTCLAMAADMGFTPYAISFSYGQRHSVELEVAKANAQKMGAAEHLVVDFDLRLMGGSALTADIAVPKQGVGSDIPVTYVPARNTIFLSFALGWAEVLGAFDIFTGVNALDYSGYPDCRPEYIAAFETMANLATKAGVEGSGSFRIRTPLIRMTKAQIEINHQVFCRAHLLCIGLGNFQLNAVALAIGKADRVWRKPHVGSHCQAGG